MSYSLTVPTHASHIPTIELDEDQRILFILGANGTGKSALLHHLYLQNRQGAANAIKITAHRQTWLPSPRPKMTLDTFLDNIRSIRRGDQNENSRFRDDYSSQRPNLALCALTKAQEDRADRLAALVDEKEFTQAEEYAEKNPKPIDRINDVFSEAGFAIEIVRAPDDRQSFIVRKTKTQETYGVDRLSDGERNALLLSAEVLTAPKDCLLLIDEPERHLHRSIMSPLLSALFSSRSDCCFVISTHEVLLPQDCEPSQVLILRDCEFQNNQGTSWDADLIDSSIELPSSIKADIWGSRRTLLYVEGEPNGADEKLYRVVFSDITVKAREGCTRVRAAVREARADEELHWLEVYGLVDRDLRGNDEIEELKSSHVYTLDTCAVESIYYCDGLQQAVGGERAEQVGADISKSIQQAHQATLDEAPTLKDLGHEQSKRLRNLIESRDAGSIVSEFPIGKSAIPNAIARKLGFRDKAEYERAVCVFVRKDQEWRARIAAMCGGLQDALGQQE